MDSELFPSTAPKGVRYCPFDFGRALDFDPVMHELLREDPVARVTMAYGSGSAWIVTRYQDVRAVTTDPRFSRAAAVGRDFARMTPVPIAPPDALMMLDPPRSGHVRAALARAFSTYGFQRLQTQTTFTVTVLLDRMIEQGPPADLVASLAGPLPMHTIWQVLGVPDEDHGWLRAQIDPIKNTDAALERTAQQSHQSVHEYLSDLTAERRAAPCDDMLSALAASHDGAQALSDAEVAALAVSLILGGHDNMTNQVGNMAYMLLTHPELQRLLTGQPERLPAVLDELLRYIPYHRGVGTPRIALQDLDLAGTRIKEGDVVYVSYVAASRDPLRFERPDELDVGRFPTGHMAFGWGPHRCPATALVMTVLTTVFSLLSQRLPTLTLAVPAEQVSWNTRSVLRSPISLPVRW